MEDRLERTLAYHCAPALAGLKAANLIGLCRREYPGLDRALEDYRRAFGPKGVHFRVLCQTGERVLVLVYRPDLLARALGQPLARQLLARAGYPAGSVEELLAVLGGRLAAGQGSFPHEIGLFLDYPPEDVEAFARRGGKGCKLCGHWKVYHDPEGALRRFARYDRCRDALCSRLSQGVSLIRMFCAA